ncbi:MAG: DNA repair protein RecO [Candidatus Eisenbacteria bacterium]
MAPVKSRAVVLRRHRVGETSGVVVCYTREYGKVRLIAKGVRRGGGRLGAALDPFVVSGVVFYLRPRQGLSLVSQAEPELEFRELRRDVERQSFAAVALELVDRLVAEQAADPGLFDALCRTLTETDQSPLEDLPAVLWAFELSLADRLGYSPSLDGCVSCDGRAGEGARFSVDDGGVVCGNCVSSGTEYGDEVVAALRKLRAGVPASSFRGLSDLVRNDVGKALLGHIERHSDHSLDLRSQKVLESLERARRSQEGASPADRKEN